MKSASFSFSTLTKGFASLAILLSATAYAGTRDHGGGTGMMVNGKLVVTDLVEQGLDANPYMPAVTPDPTIIAALKQNLKLPEPLKSDVLIPLAAKLTEIDQVVRPAGLYIASGFGFYDFKTTNLPLAQLDDVDSAIGAARIQLATRKGDSIYISLPNWKLLDEANRVALLMHEVIYAFQPLPTGCTEQSSGGLFYHHDEMDCSHSQIDAVLATSSKARFLNAFFFNADWKENWQDRLAKEMQTSPDAGDYSVYNALFGVMVGEHGTKARIAKMVLSGGTMSPSFSRLPVLFNGYRGASNENKPIGYLTSDSTKKDMYRLCQLGTNDPYPVQPQSFNVFSPFSRPYESPKYARVDAKIENLTIGMGVVTTRKTGYGYDYNTIILSIDASKQAECVLQLIQIKKDNFAN